MPCLLAINRQSQRERTLKRPLTFGSGLQPASALRSAIDGWADEASAQHTYPCQPRLRGTEGVELHSPAFIPYTGMGPERAAE
ncbi:MAG: hypothetical protein RBT80_24915 [Candidatus Vecturithrix sp.]|jgi:hypothetical protein|nr:hypothetical protein [Candidatus Vecturithrix sp.]